MKKFNNGVAWFTRATVDLWFPEDQTVCRHCALLHNDYGLSRAFCVRTGEIIPAPDAMRGQFCPLKWEEQKEEK